MLRACGRRGGRGRNPPDPTGTNADSSRGLLHAGAAYLPVGLQHLDGRLGKPSI